MNLGAEVAGGDRERLIRELDRLKSIGVRNLRILAASEGPNTEPWRIIPALQTEPGAFDENLLRGLDFTLDELRKRGMLAVLCLNNFWHWSGGMAQYVSWTGGGAIPYPPPAAGGSWETYQDYTQQFYANEKAMELFNNVVRKIITRTNYYSGIPYAQDPAIMTWQLANEPRGRANADLFNQWISRTAKLIKSFDSNHLVTVGSEGETPAATPNGMNFSTNHSDSNID